MFKINLCLFNFFIYKKFKSNIENKVMPKNLLRESDEINLIMLLQIIWEGKLKIIIPMIISVILLFQFSS